MDIDNSIIRESPTERYEGKSIYLLHYPHGLKAECSTGIIKSLDENNQLIRHLCPTETGSSGSPILNLSNCKVIGIHIGTKEGKNWNLGAFIKVPIEIFSKKFCLNKICNKLINEPIFNLENIPTKNYKDKNNLNKGNNFNNIQQFNNSHQSNNIQMQQINNSQQQQSNNRQQKNNINPYDKCFQNILINNKQKTYKIGNQQMMGNNNQNSGNWNNIQNMNNFNIQQMMRNNNQNAGNWNNNQNMNNFDIQQMMRNNNQNAGNWNNNHNMNNFGNQQMMGNYNQNVGNWNNKNQIIKNQNNYLVQKKNPLEYMLNIKLD